MKHILSIAAAAAALAFATAAGAAVHVMGEGQARGCYEAARADRSDADAVGLCDAALRDTPLLRRNRAETLVNRGIIFLNRDNYQGALIDFNEAVRLAPDLAEAHVHRGVALIALRDYQGAVTAITHGIELGPQEPAKAHFNRAMAYEDMGDIAAAYRDYQTANRLAPEWRVASTELSRFQVRR